MVPYNNLKILNPYHDPGHAFRNNVGVQQWLLLRRISALALAVNVKN